MPCYGGAPPGEGCGRLLGSCAGATYGFQCSGDDCESCFFGEFTDGPSVILGKKPSPTATIGTIVIKPAEVADYPGLQVGDIITHVDKVPVRGIGATLLLRQERKKAVVIRRGEKRVKVRLGACHVDGVGFHVCAPGDLSRFGVQSGDVIEHLNDRRILGADDILNIQREPVSSLIIERNGERITIDLRADTSPV